MSGTHAFFLQGEDCMITYCQAHFFGAVTHHNHGFIGSQHPGGIHRVQDKRLAVHRMQHFWQVRDHAGSLAGSEYDG